MGPVVEGLEHRNKRSRLDSLDNRERFMVLEKRHSMIRAVFPGDELIDSIDQRTETLLGEQDWQKQRMSAGSSQKEDSPGLWPD